MDTDTSLDEIKESMKKIVKNTNSVLKHSMIAFKKTKQKLLFLDNDLMIPSKETKGWFKKRMIEKISIPDFFDLLFKEASMNNRLDFTTRSIVFSEEDAVIFGFEANTKINIIDIFERLPKYFE
jgi:hypothetical protein